MKRVAADPKLKAFATEFDKLSSFLRAVSSVRRDARASLR